MCLFLQALLLLHSSLQCSSCTLGFSQLQTVEPLPVSFQGQIHYEYLKLVLPPFPTSYTFSATLEQRMWKTVSVSAYENRLLLFSSAPLFYQSTSKYLSINSCVSTLPLKNCEKAYCEKSNPIEVSQGEDTLYLETMQYI